MPRVVAAAPGIAYLMNLHGAVNSGSVRYVKQGLSTAADQDARIVILEIHPHGGQLSAALNIVHAILHSAVPVAGLVFPGGTHLGFPGLYILFACPVAAMAPTTYLDTKVPQSMKGTLGGMGIPPQQIAEADATLRALAMRYKRYDPWDVSDLRQGTPLKAIDAKQFHVVDYLVTSPQALLFAVNGRRIQGMEGWQVLHTSQLVIERDSTRWHEPVQALMANPNFIYLLLILGIFGILFELAGPGLILPGTVGTLSLVLALYALQGVPINYGGLGLMLAGIGLVVLASYRNRFKLLGVMGVAAFAIGSLLLFDIKGVQVSLVMVGGLAILSAILFWGLSRRLISLRRRGAISGREVIVGSTGIVAKDFIGQGQIHLNGELWQATSKLPLQRGQRVRVVGLQGLTLEVIPEEK